MGETPSQAKKSSRSSTLKVKLPGCDSQSSGLNFALRLNIMLARTSIFLYNCWLVFICYKFLNGIYLLERQNMTTYFTYIKGLLHLTVDNPLINANLPDAVPFHAS